METITFSGQRVKCQRDEIGILPNGDKVVVATDSAGSQIIVSGEETHLLSRAFKDHEAACDAAKRVMVAGNPEEAFGCGWTNLRTAGLGESLFAAFMGAFVPPNKGKTSPDRGPSAIYQHLFPDDPDGTGETQTTERK